MLLMNADPYYVVAAEALCQGEDDELAKQFSETLTEFKAKGLKLDNLKDQIPWETLETQRPILASSWTEQLRAACNAHAPTQAAQVTQPSQLNPKPHRSLQRQLYTYTAWANRRHDVT